MNNKDISLALPELTLEEILLAACERVGALALRDLFREVAELAGGKEFTSSEICAYAALSENRRLRRAMESKLGADYGVGKLGKLFAQYAGVDIAGTVIRAIGAESNSILWAVQTKTEHPKDGEE